MKNILIPTSFELDTIQALKLSSSFKQNDHVRITLLTVTPPTDSITQLLFPSTEKAFDMKKRQQVMDAWELHREEHKLNHIRTTEHHQYGLSRPVLKQVLERFAIDLTVVPSSLQHSKDHTTKQLLRLLSESNIPLMLMPGENDLNEDIHRALYLEDDGATTAPLIQDLPFHVIRQSMISSNGVQSMQSVIDNFRINLIVLAKGKERKLIEPLTDLGLPVLTI